MARTPPHPTQPSVAQLQFELSEAAKLYTTAQQQLTSLKSAYNTLATHNTQLQQSLKQQQLLTQQRETERNTLEADYQQHYAAYTTALQEKEDELTHLLATHVPLDALEVLRVKVREEAREAMRDKTTQVLDELSTVRSQLAAAQKEKAVQAVQHEHSTAVLQSQLERMRGDSESRGEEWKRRAIQWQEKEEERRVERGRWEAVERENVEWTVRWKRASEESEERRKEEERREDGHRRERMEWEREKGEWSSQRAVSTQQLAITKRQNEEAEKERDRCKREVSEWREKVDELMEEVREMREEGRRRDGEVSGLREMYERRVREKEQAEADRDRQQRLAVDELYGQVKSEREAKEVLRRQLLDKQDELLQLVKRHTESDAAVASTTTPSSSTTATSTTTAATISQLQADLAACRNQLATAHTRIRAMDEQHTRLLQRYEQANTQWQSQQRDSLEREQEFSTLQVRYRECRERESGWREKVEECSVVVGVLERERDELRREREEERRWMVEGREQQLRGWRQEKAVLLHRLAGGEGGASSGGKGGEGKYKAMCSVMKERLEGMVREYQKERGEWEQKLQTQQLAMEEMHRRTAETDKFQQQLHRSMQTPTKLAHLS